MPKIVPRLSLPAITNALATPGRGLANDLSQKRLPLSGDGGDVNLAAANESVDDWAFSDGADDDRVSW